VPGTVEIQTRAEMDASERGKPNRLNSRSLRMPSGAAAAFALALVPVRGPVLGKLPSHKLQ